MAIEWRERPYLGDFSIKKVGNEIAFHFSFSNVDGGIENAEFTFIVAIYRQNLLVKLSSYVAGLNIENNEHEIININGDISQGDFRSKGEISLMNKIKGGDRVVYYVMLTDSSGRTSNLVKYKFVADWLDI